MIWLLVDQNVVSTSSIPALTHVALLVLAVMMAVQVDTDEVDSR